MQADEAYGKLKKAVYLCPIFFFLKQTSFLKERQKRKPGLDVHSILEDGGFLFSLKRNFKVENNSTISKFLLA